MTQHAVHAPTSASTGKVQKALDRLREEGLGSLARKFFHDHIYRRKDAYQLIVDLTVEEKLSQEAVEGTEFLVVTSMAELPPLEGWIAGREDDFAFMLEQGAIGYFALYKGQAVAACWANECKFYDRHTGVTVKVPRGQIYAHSMMVDMKHRDAGLARMMGAMIMRDIRSRGFDGIFTHVFEDNEISYRFQRIAGFRREQHSYSRIFDPAQEFQGGQ